MSEPGELTEHLTENVTQPPAEVAVEQARPAAVGFTDAPPQDAAYSQPPPAAQAAADPPEPAERASGVDPAASGGGGGSRQGPRPPAFQPARNHHPDSVDAALTARALHVQGVPLEAQARHGSAAWPR